jgi:hypothetical protein
MLIENTDLPLMTWIFLSPMDSRTTSKGVLLFDLFNDGGSARKRQRPRRGRPR